MFGMKAGGFQKAKFLQNFYQAKRVTLTLSALWPLILLYLEPIDQHFTVKAAVKIALSCSNILHYGRLLA